VHAAAARELPDVVDQRVVGDEQDVVRPGLAGQRALLRPAAARAAAVSSSIPSGTGTARSAGTIACSVYPAPSTMAQATRSPTRTSVTCSPTAVTVPAPSAPMTNGVRAG